MTASKFSANTCFAIYAGLPLSLSEGRCIAWDRAAGRQFDEELFHMVAAPCLEGDFRKALVKWSDATYRRESAKSIPIVLPKQFPAGTKFADYEETPVTEFDKEAVAWDRPGGRYFSGADFFPKHPRVLRKDFERW
jgi:hypothetical protein